MYTPSLNEILSVDVNVYTYPSSFKLVNVTSETVLLSTPSRLSVTSYFVFSLKLISIVLSVSADITDVSANS